jgi:hypothetical protein
MLEVADLQALTAKTGANKYKLVNFLSQIGDICDNRAILPRLLFLHHPGRHDSRRRPQTIAGTSPKELILMWI